MGRMKSLTNKNLLWFVGSSIVILLICTPLFFYLTRHFYAEEMVDLIESMRAGKDIPPSDLEQDIMTGVMIQFALFILVIGAASIVTMRFVSRRLWAPFYDTLSKTADFDLDKEPPVLSETDIREFDSLNRTLSELMRRDRDTFESQKEFTQNASHELQTPLAVIQSKLDLLLQENLDERQSKLVQDMYSAGNRMARLNRDLLLLAKIDNSQYRKDEIVDLRRLVENCSEICGNLFKRLNIISTFSEDCSVKANETLLETLVNNLIVNAARNVPPEGKIIIACSGECLEISNTASNGALDAAHIFDRFRHTEGSNPGNGIGLSIVKAVCDYHGWSIDYTFSDGEHHFTVSFPQNLWSIGIF